MKRKVVVEIDVCDEDDALCGEDCAYLRSFCDGECCILTGGGDVFIDVGQPAERLYLNELMEACYRTPACLGAESDESEIEISARVEEEAKADPATAASPECEDVGVLGDRCEPGNECGRTGCPNCQA